MRRKEIPAEEKEEAYKKVLSLLEGLGEQAHVCAGGSTELVLPGLWVEGIGEISLPIQPKEAKALIEVAEQAPYGRRDQTLLDTSVRRVWQIDASRFSLKSPLWEALLARIVGEVMARLGLKHKATPELYKLLIYEAGSFFIPHRDTEKEKGMFATLVINLPSRHEGGALIIRHEGEEYTYDFSKKSSLYELAYAAFYADCKHEVQPVQSGYRVTLVYNLCVAKRQQQPSAPRFLERADEIAAVLPALFEGGKRDKIVIPLKHQYTEENLHPHVLKGGDIALLATLSRAAKQAGCQAFLALWTLHQSGNVDDDSLYHSGYRRYSRWDDDDFDEDAVEFDSVEDQDSLLSKWFSPEGEAVSLPDLELNEEEVISDQLLEEYEKTQSVEEASGNAGVSMERWYRHGAIVIWPQARFSQVVSKEELGRSISALSYLLERIRDDASFAEARRFAEACLNRWKPLGDYRERAYPFAAFQMANALFSLRDEALLSRFVCEILPYTQEGKEGDVLRGCAHLFGWAAWRPILQRFFSSIERVSEQADIYKVIQIFHDLAGKGRGASEEEKQTLLVCAEALFSSLRRWDEGKEADYYDFRKSKAEDVFVSFFLALYRVEADVLLSEFLAHIVANPTIYSLRECLFPAFAKIDPFLFKEHPCFDAYQKLADYAISLYDKLTKKPPTPPKDWSRDTKLSCSCELCKPFQAFLADPNETVYTLKSPERNRSHLENVIANHHCDIDTETLRKGSPLTLLCKKNRATYERLREQYEEDTAAQQSIQDRLDSASKRLEPKKRFGEKEDDHFDSFFVGQRVLIRRDAFLPDDPSFYLGGWSGKIQAIEDAPEAQSRLLEILWDERTRYQMPQSFIQESEREDLDWTRIWLDESDVEPDGFDEEIENVNVYELGEESEDDEESEE